MNKVIEGYNNNKIVVNTGGAELGKSVSEAVVSKLSKLVVQRRIHTLDDHQDEVQALKLW